MGERLLSGCVEGTVPKSNRLIAVLCSLCAVILMNTGGCDDVAFSISPGQVTIVKGGSRVRIANGREAPIFFFVVERETAAAINWAPCTNPDGCLRVDPGKIEMLQVTAIVGFRPDAEEAILYWWHLIPTEGDEFTVDEIRHTVFDL